MSEHEFIEYLFPADWGKRKRKVIIEISECENKNTHFECFVQEGNITLPASEITESVISDFAPLIAVANRMLDDIPDEIVEDQP